MMDIRMIGIDHQNASIEQRELFAFTKAQAIRAMEKWHQNRYFSGCLLLSTCNRTELWVSGGNPADDLFTFLCREKECEPEGMRSLVIQRNGHEAVTHLLQLICGLKSKIYGEDQILSQIRDALELSRSCHCSNTVIEKLFQTAVSAGKRVKTQVKIETADPSAARNVLLLLKDKMDTIKGLPCLIIGNGQMGKLVASTLVEAGAEVTMTLRKKFHGNDAQNSIVPYGCTMIDYEDRIEALQNNKVVISATLSPHFTISAEHIEGKTFEDSIWIDMAVPRDIDPKAGQIDGIQLYDMDRLGDSHVEARTEQSLKESMEILEQYQEKLERWFAFREHVDTVKAISETVAEDACKRMDIQDDNILPEMEGAADRAVRKLLFGLRDTLPQQEWQLCLDALQKSAARDTLKTGKAK